MLGEKNKPNQRRKYTNNCFPLEKYFPTIFNDKAEVIEGRLQKASFSLIRPTNAHATPLVHTHVGRTSLVWTRRSLSPAESSTSMPFL